MDKPLVSIICLCYNHGRYIEQAITSVLNQSYEHTELIVVDDASTDDSHVIIEKMSETYGFQFHVNPTNLGNCRSFNIGLKLSTGKYVIDLAADDQLMPIRVREGVRNLDEKGGTYAVDFCDVELIDPDGQNEGTHFKRDVHGNLVEPIRDGDMYKILVERYFLSAPGMMMRRTVLEELGGYDENLSYEDFDFWVRSSRNYKYAFTDQVLVKKHILTDSLSASQYQRKNKHCLSTATICEKALKLNETNEENAALLKRINYELKWALITENWEASTKFIDLKHKLLKSHWSFGIHNLIIKIKPPWFSLWKMIL